VAQLRAYATFLSARRPGWQRLLRGYDLVVVNRKQHGWLGSALTRLPGWRAVYSGHDGLVLERAGPPGAVPAGDRGPRAVSARAGPSFP